MLACRMYLTESLYKATRLSQEHASEEADLVIIDIRTYSRTVTFKMVD